MTYEIEIESRDAAGIEGEIGRKRFSEVNMKFIFQGLSNPLITI
jgi:hypothetical protein